VQRIKPHRRAPVAGYVLASVLFAAGVAKLAALQANSTSILAGFEVAGAALLFAGRAVKVVCYASAALGTAGVVHGILADVPCSCLGPHIELDRAKHLMLASATGALAVLALMHSGTTRPTAV
jgi:hypothetical protein